MLINSALMESATANNLALASCYDNLSLFESYLNTLNFLHPAPMAMPLENLFTVDEPTCFDDLPRELRDKIWEHALPNGRIVKADVIDGLWKQTFDYDGGVDSPKYRCRIPNLLHVCRESREIALKHYQPLLTDPSGHPMFFFNPKVDTLSIGKNRYNGPRDDNNNTYAIPMNAINGSIVHLLAITLRDMKFAMLIRRSFLEEFPNIIELFFFQSEPLPPRSALIYPTKGKYPIPIRYSISLTYVQIYSNTST